MAAEAADDVKNQEEMPTVGIGFYWTDLKVGQKFKSLGRTITEADLAAFVNATGFTEMLFVNTEYLREHTPYEGRLIPGAMVFSMMEGMLMQATMQMTGIAFLNMEMNIEGPCFAGDTLHVEVEVTELSPKKKGRALVRTRNVIKNQKGETVMVYTPLRMMEGRPGAA